MTTFRTRPLHGGASTAMRRTSQQAKKWVMPKFRQLNWLGLYDPSKSKSNQGLIENSDPNLLPELESLQGNWLKWWPRCWNRSNIGWFN